MNTEMYDPLSEGGDSAAAERSIEASKTSELREELLAMSQDQVDSKTKEQSPQDRLKVFDGLTEAQSEQLGPDDKYRFLITAAVQSSPTELGTWLSGNGDGFRATDRPVNTSLIDQDHNFTFAGYNGFILEPPADGNDVVAATAHDVGSSGLDMQEVVTNGDQLLAETPPTGYNQVNIKAGKLQGVFIRKTESGQELGREGANQELRNFAAEHGLPVVELVVKPQELKYGDSTMEELPANKGNQLWKMELPEDGRLGEVYVVRFQPGEHPKGFNLDPNGFDIGIRDIDPYGSTDYVMDDANKLSQILDRLSEMPDKVSEADKPALHFAIHRIKTRIEELNTAVA